MDNSGISNYNSSNSSEGSIHSDLYTSDIYDNRAYNSDINESPMAE